MRLVPKGWNNETWICSIRGHVAPAASASRLRPEDHLLGIDSGDGTRLSRCLRCDLWTCGVPPVGDDVAYESIPPLDQLDLPRRGKPLEDAILIRLIALDRAVHAVLFSLLAIALILVELRLGSIQEWARSIADSLNGAVAESAQGGSHAFLTRHLASVADLESAEVAILLITSTAYAVVEGVEAVFLWKERRWAEYLTVVATVGFIPFEVRELLNRVTVLRVGALVVNVAILGWLVWNKRLFGLRGGAAALNDRIDWETIVADPTAGVRSAASRA